MTTPEVTFGCNFNVEGHGGYWDIAEFAQQAESLGLDRVTIGEHVMETQSAPADPPQYSGHGLRRRRHQNPEGNDRNSHRSSLPPAHSL